MGGDRAKQYGKVRISRDERVHTISGHRRALVNGKNSERPAGKKKVKCKWEVWGRCQETKGGPKNQLVSNRDKQKTTPGIVGNRKSGNEGGGSGGKLWAGHDSKGMGRGDELVPEKDKTQEGARWFGEGICPVEVAQSRD